MTTRSSIQSTSSLAPAARPLTRHLPTVLRIVAGLVWLASGLFGLTIAFGLAPLPEPSTPQPEAATALLAAIARTGYLFVLIKATEAGVGALLLANRFVPLALVVLAPVLVNIVAFHAFLAPSGLGLVLALVAVEIYLAWVYREAFAPLLRARAQAGGR